MSADGFTDWNKFTLDQHCEILENEFRFSSSGIAKSVFELIEFYKKHKPSEGNTQPDTESKLNIAYVTNRTFKCNRCGTVYTLTEGTHIGCCTMPTEHRTSGICGGELIEVVS